MLSACAVASAGTTVYTWVDAQGVTHYSDQPHAGATKLKVGDAPTYSAPRTASVSEPTAASGEPKADCAIESPSDQQMLMNAWSVSGHIRMPQQLTPDDRVVLLLDGAVLADAADLSGNFNIAQIDRGQHTLGAQVLTPTGQVLCQAPSITFFVHQPTTLSPQSPTATQPQAPTPRPH
jgi:hypothetical protein